MESIRNLGKACQGKRGQNRNTGCFFFKKNSWQVCNICRKWEVWQNQQEPKNGTGRNSI